MPALRDVGGGHLARCHRAEEIASGAVDPVSASTPAKTESADG
jgi:hypothetical protein